MAREVRRGNTANLTFVGNEFPYECQPRVRKISPVHSREENVDVHAAKAVLYKTTWPGPRTHAKSGVRRHSRLGAPKVYFGC